MSGPKSAEYYLTDEQRAVLAEQRLVSALREQLNVISLKFSFNESEIDGFRENAREILSLSGSDNGYSEKEKEFEKYSSELKKIYQESKNLITSEELSAKYKQIQQILNQRDSVLSEMHKADLENISRIKSHYGKQLENSLNTDFSGIKSKSQKEAEKLAGTVLRNLDDMLSGNPPADIAKEISQAREKLGRLDSVQEIKNFNAVTVGAISRKISEYNELYRTSEELRIRYEALCRTENIPPKHFEISRENIEIIKLKISEISLKSAESDEQEYISRCIDEVMEDMGYNLIGKRSVTKKSGKKFRNELYNFSEGTALNITYSSDGQIAVELGGLDSCDRIPTAGETDFLCDEMNGFCGKFTEFQHRLAEKGVLPKKLSVLPPAPEYAQIINTGDYEITGRFTEISAEKVRKEKKHMKSE